jgi:hypothetical protein
MQFQISNTQISKHIQFHIKHTIQISKHIQFHIHAISNNQTHNLHFK